MTPGPGITVAAADPRDPGPAALLAQSHALMRAMFPTDACHFLDLAALAGPDIRFVAASADGAVLGTGALALRDGYSEVKSMFTAPEARGRGVADAVLRHLIGLARAEGCGVLRLETGVGLDAAHRLYARHGFRPRGPFGTYRAQPESLFYERAV
ncbi:GNAT family N-acetyltransferase [Jannaschia ovalis]|uniref:GNAT family N-acetyltransferase n=1 Tax=Jannaschia ovalis TaxID=3038773 RepID=A0ABY8LH41_9RHOB|nr:GNAT family N-acetyltransferase [Jannaschia sp. GRR-S6-38]WGH79423.1 GNAT family N-acetyltransferase [Jannaschia sp. GRR-S6-38]